MDAKKKNKRIILAAASVLVAAVCAAAVPVSGYLSGLNSQLPEASSSEEAVAESAVAGVITDAEIEDLLGGETTLDELESKLAAAAPEDETAGSEAEGEDEPASERVSGKAASEPSASASASSSKALAVSGSASSSKAASSETASSKDTSSKTASSKVPAYEAEVKAQIQELYVLRAQALKDLDSNIESARAEYHALPEEQQTTVRKVSIAFSRAGQLTKLQSYYDKEVDRIVGEMRTTLEANGQSTELADEAMASYKKQKSEMYSSLMAKLYK